ncbi:TetR family transcriptional regulator [Streptomyces sp. SID13031]|uniref:TetR/AcrR family transcriptional regulator n=1 Tax=Streptomyces sp. SID13031 TaxID=2706046 RepID=UPI0013C9473C|nr:TetR family transcriptional regulator [Streptomyces sp. SID13031]NEA32515.1 helix-turn-helix transcriptional regulator [Streptomyces sp. SID13031]
MTAAEKTARADRAGATRDVILATAERLFAEHGVFGVSNRQISEAAGQGNNAAVGYHFGTKTDLVRAIVRRHTEQIERLRARMLAGLPAEPELRDWLNCLIRPQTEHLAETGPPTWFARFGAQVMTDPGLRRIMVEESLSSPSLQQSIDGLKLSLPALPPEVRRERSDMARLLMVHLLAEYERGVAEGTPVLRATWDDTATGLIDALAGLWTAPVTG